MLPRGHWLISQLLSHGCSSRPDLQISNRCSLTELLPEFALRTKQTSKEREREYYDKPNIQFLETSVLHNIT